MPRATTGRTIVKCAYCGNKVSKRSIYIKYATRAGRPLYCGYACSNRARTRNVQWSCDFCGVLTSKRKQNKVRPKYCTSRCAGLGIAKMRRDTYIAKWLSGKINADGYRVSSFIRSYLFEKHGNACSVCGWGKTNPATGRVPLELEHVNGNWMDNSPGNIKLLCPNCHSLTPTYKALNKGRGRKPYQAKGKKNAA